MSLTSRLKQVGKKALPFLLVGALLNPIQAQEKKEKSDWLYHGLEASYIALNYLDYSTTKRALQNGATELNPLMEYPIPCKLGMTSLFLYASRQIKKDDEKQAKRLLLLGNLFYGAIVLNNYLLNQRHIKWE